MTDRLSPHHIGASSEEISIESFEKLLSPDIDAIHYPEPALSDLEEYNMSPAALRDDGHDLPTDDEDPEEALALAIEHFKGTDSYYEWQEGFAPVSRYIWPCDPLVDKKKLVQSLNDNYLACTYVEGEVDGKDYQGFMLSGGNANLADHLAIAYIEAGFIPPTEILDRAFGNTRKDEWTEKLLDAMVQASAWYSSEAERMNGIIERHRAAEARP